MNQGFKPGFGRPNNFNQTSFWGPFLLGGITGGLVSPFFYSRPYYRPYYSYGPYYGPYYYR